MKSESELPQDALMKDDNETKQRPILMACINGDIDIVKLLIENKCNIECEDYQKQRPIHMACFKGDINIVKLLIEMKCDIECEDNYKQRPIHISFINRHIDIVKLLIEMNCEIECKDMNKQSPIHLACRNGYIDIVKLLIEMKCDIECEDIYKQRPIHIAFINRHIDIVKLLIEMNCDIECEDMNKQRPIHIACRNGDIDIVQLLIGRGCDIYSQDAYKFDPIFVASLFGYHKIVDLLRQRGGARLEDDLEFIADKMGLKCGPDCDHGGFCRESFMSSTFQKEEISKGSYSVVYRLTESATNRQFALKCIPLRNMVDPSILGNIKTFINICMNSLSHDNIIRFFGAIELSDELWIYMEYMEGTSLIEYTKDNETIPREKIVEQINRGASFLRDRRIIYGQINPENILVDRNGNIKISDFGWSHFSWNSSDYNNEDLPQKVNIKQLWNVEENSDRYCESLLQDGLGRILVENEFLKNKIQEIESQNENYQNENKAFNERYKKEIEDLKQQLSNTVEKYSDERNNMNEILPKKEESKLEYKTRRNNRESNKKIIIIGILSIVTVVLLIFYIFQQTSRGYKEGPNIINNKRSSQRISERAKSRNHSTEIKKNFESKLKSKDKIIETSSLKIVKLKDEVFNLKSQVKHRETTIEKLAESVHKLTKDSRVNQLKIRSDAEKSKRELQLRIAELSNSELERKKLTETIEKLNRNKETGEKEQLLNDVIMESYLMNVFITVICFVLDRIVFGQTNMSFFQSAVFELERRESEYSDLVNDLIETILRDESVEQGNMNIDHPAISEEGYVIYSVQVWNLVYNGIN